VELALGRLDRPAMLQLFLVQWAWVLVFALATRVLWRSGLKRFGAFGG
jgi:ABC-type uncharacterized transport system permease subunit